MLPLRRLMAFPGVFLCDRIGLGGPHVSMSTRAALGQRGFGRFWHGHARQFTARNLYFVVAACDLRGDSGEVPEGGAFRLRP